VKVRFGKEIQTRVATIHLSPGPSLHAVLLTKIYIADFKVNNQENVYRMAATNIYTGLRTGSSYAVLCLCTPCLFGETY